MEDLAKRIKAEAVSLGFSFTAFTGISQPPHYKNYIAWISSGFSGSMHYLSSQRIIDSRKKPAALLKKAKSMIVFGFHYQPFTLKSNPLGHPVGIIAAYAAYKDYHAVLKQKAHQLMKNVNNHTDENINYRLFIDSGPVMEKDTAYMAGAGWIGKNSLLITPEFGTFQVLGCILIDQLLPTSKPFPRDLCGSCQRCISACPTNCISEQHSIDASQCIAYLTIEHKGIIPRELRAKMGNRIYGCDICQDICPNNNKIFNQKSPASSSKSIFYQKNNTVVDLLNEIQISEIEFQNKFQGTPVIRATYEGYKRNLIIALGNSESPLVIPLLENILLSDNSWLLRLHAAWALGEIHTNVSLQIIRKHLKIEIDEKVNNEINFMLSQ